MATTAHKAPVGPNGPVSPGSTVTPPMSGNAGAPSQKRDTSDPWLGTKGGTPSSPDVSKGSMGEVKKTDAKDSKVTKGIADNKGAPKESVISKTALKHKTPAQKMYPSLKTQDGD